MAASLDQHADKKYVQIIIMQTSVKIQTYHVSSLSIGVCALK